MPKASPAPFRKVPKGNAASEDKEQAVPKKALMVTPKQFLPRYELNDEGYCEVLKDRGVIGNDRMSPASWRDRRQSPICAEPQWAGRRGPGATNCGSIFRGPRLHT